jgi:hypothetical protein
MSRPLAASLVVLVLGAGLSVLEATAKRSDRRGSPWSVRISAELGVSRYELERPPAGGLIGWAFDGDGQPLARYAHPREGTRSPVGLGAAGRLSPVSCDTLLTSFFESGFLCALTEGDDPCAWADLYAFAWIQSCRE